MQWTKLLHQQKLMVPGKNPEKSELSNTAAARDPGPIWDLSTMPTNLQVKNFKHQVAWK